MYRTAAGVVKRYPLGKYHDISLSAAKAGARAGMAVVNTGDDPALARKSYRQSAQTSEYIFTPGNGRIRSLKDYRKKNYRHGGRRFT